VPFLDTGDTVFVQDAAIPGAGPPGRARGDFMAKFLVTGGAGFIGTNVVRELCKLGEKVVLFDNFSSGKKRNLSGLPKDVKVVEGTCLDVKEVKKVARSCDFVVHLLSSRPAATR
jgi:nucleoside-diphosphate-sugar epimerase